MKLKIMLEDKVYNTLKFLLSKMLELMNCLETLQKSFQRNLQIKKPAVSELKELSIKKMEISKVIAAENE